MQLGTVHEGIKRDRYGRALIAPPGGGKPVPYTRASTIGKALEAQDALVAWKQRMTLIGASLSSHVMVSVAAHRDDKAKLNALAEDAMQAAQAYGRREVGTALHKLTETIDAGRDPGTYPDEYAADVAAYKRTTSGWEYAGAEMFVVCDELQVAGTFDRLRYIRETNTLRVCDLKTGGGVDYAALSIAVQLAVYAHGCLYDPATGLRQPLASLVPGATVDTATGTVVHLPAGAGRCEARPVDLVAGWDAARLAVAVRDIRNSARKWIGPAETTAPVDLDAAIATAPTTSDLAALWRANRSTWTDDHSALAAARKALLEAGVVA